MCWGCLHPFTDNNLKQIHIEGGLRSVFEEVRMGIRSLSDVKPQTARLQKISETLLMNYNQLVVRVEAELLEKAKALEMLKKKEPDRIDVRLASHDHIIPPAPASPKPDPKKRTRPASASVRSSFGGAPAQPQPQPQPQPPASPPRSCVSPPRRPIRPASRPLKSVKNRFGHEVFGVGGAAAVKTAAAAGQQALCQQVMLSLYLVLDAVLSQLCATKAVVWWRVHGLNPSETGEELMTLITAESGRRRRPADEGSGSGSGAAASGRKNLSQGAVGAVVSSSIALNIGGGEQATPEHGPSDRRGSADTASGAAAPEEASASALHADDEYALILPIPLSGRVFSRVCIGALQLTGRSAGTSQGPVAPFSENDEAVALGCVSSLSHILTHYKALLGAGNAAAALNGDAFTALARASAPPPHGELGLSMGTQYPPMLVHRTWGVSSERLGRTALLGTKKEIELCARVKELERFQCTLEVAWKQSVAQLAESESRRQGQRLGTADLKGQLSAAKQQLRVLEEHLRGAEEQLRESAAEKAQGAAGRSNAAGGAARRGPARGKVPVGERRG